MLLSQASFSDEWTSLFNGKDLAGWHAIRADAFEHSQATVTNGMMLIGPGEPGAGLALRQKDFPTMDYEIELKAKRIQGFDFFCGLNVPVSNQWITLIVGGWDGEVVGLSNLDGLSAADNDYARHIDFKQNHWYTIRMRVELERITVWLDDQALIRAETKGVKIGIRDTMEGLKPMGICSWLTQAGIKDIRVRRL